MKLLFQILFFLFTWFNLSATPTFTIVALPTYAISFPKEANKNLASELKIYVSNFARSGISENSFSQKAILWESSVVENRAREANDRLVQGAGRQTWNGFANIFKANADEIFEATTKIKNHRITQNAGTQGNYGYLEGNIGNVTKNGDIIRSGAADDVAEVFDALPVNSQQVVGGDGAWLRNTDSEFKMLNRTANELNAVKGQKYPLITGELKVVSERPYCPSCQGVIQQFHEMFPNVKLILVDGAR